MKKNKRLKIISLSLFLFLLSSSLYAQNTDSLLNLISISPDSVKYRIYIKLWLNNPIDSLEKSIFYVEQVEKYSRKCMPDNKYAEMLNGIGIDFYLRGNYTYAEKYFKKSIEIEKKLNNKAKIAETYSNIAVTLEQRSEYQEATQYYLKAAELFEKTNSDYGLATIYSNLGVLYAEMGTNQQAEKYHKKSLTIKQKLKDNEGIAQTYNNLGVLHEKLNNIDSAMFYYLEAMEFYKNLSDKKTQSLLLKNIANIYLMKKQYDKAQQYLQEAEEISITNNYSQELAWNYQMLAKLYFETKQYDKCEQYLKKTEKIVTQIGDLKTQTEIYKQYADLYYKTKKYQFSANYLYRFQELKDSLSSSEVQQNVYELNKKYQTTVLQYKLDLSDKTNKLATEKIKRNNIFIITLIIIIVLLLTAFILIRKMLKNKTLLQKSELEQKVLRLQMNPHFVSNALVSVQNFILENKTIEASDYLSNFTALMRDTIKATRNDLITLEDEIEITRKYLQIQQYRNPDLFDYHIDIQNDIETEFYYFPPMILQPFVENSIKHGFSNIKYKGKIDIKIKLENENIITQIIDNGIGYSPNIKNKSHKSYSLEITKERLELLSKKYKTKANIAISNINDKSNTGTCVKLCIPNTIE